MNRLQDFFISTSNILKADFDRSAQINHNGDKGKNREYFINNFLKKSFPQKFVIGNGEIIDSAEQISKQADIIIYDEHMPVFDYGSSHHFLSGGVLAHIEVKSYLDTKEIEDVFQKTASVKILNRDIDSSMSFGHTPTSIFSCCFAYTGLKKEAFKEKFTEQIKKLGDDKKEINLICVLNEYFVLKWFNQASNRFEFCFVEMKENTLMYFFIHLFNAMQKNWAGIPQINKYLGTSPDVILRVF